jgi:hypothetical protein
MNHSTSKRTARKAVAPQIEATVLIEGTTAKIIPCTAKKDFQVGNSQVKAGEKFYLVRSERREDRYYVVHYNGTRNAYQCSCGCNMCEHEHLKTVREYVMSHVVAPAASAKAEQSSSPIETPAPMTTPLTAAQWREIMKRDKARQKAEKAKDMAKIQEAREQARRELAATG